MGSLGPFIEVLDKATVVEWGDPQRVGRVWDVHSRSDIKDSIAANGDRVEAFGARAGAERA